MSTLLGGINQRAMITPAKKQEDNDEWSEYSTEELRAIAAGQEPDSSDEWSEYSTEELKAIAASSGGGLMEGAQDTAVAFGRGSNALLKMAGDLYGLATGDMDNAAREFGQFGIDYWQARQSDNFKARDAARRAKIDAEQDELGKAWAYVRETVTDPLLISTTLGEQAPNLVALGGMGRLAAGGARFVLNRIGSLTAEQAAAQAVKVGVGAAVAGGAALQGGDVGGDQYSDFVRQLDQLPDEQATRIPAIAELVTRGASLDEAKLAFALTQARKTAAAAGAVSVGSQLVPGGRTLERALVGGPGSAAARGLAGRIVAGAAGEGAQEMLEEGGGKVAANLFMRPLDPRRPLTQGLGETMAQAGLVGALPGGLAGAANRPAAPAVNQETSQDPATTPANEEQAAFDPKGTAQASGPQSDSGTPAADNTAADAGGLTSASRTSSPGPRTQRLDEASQDSANTISPSDTARTINPPADAGEANRLVLGVEDPATGKKIIQPTNDVNWLLRTADVALAPFMGELKSLAAAIPGVQVMGARVKGDTPRLRQKMQGRPASQISDYLGGRLAIDNEAAAEAVIAQLGGRIIENENFYNKPKAGYRARHIQVQLPSGLTAELQLIPKELAAVQGLAHLAYEIARAPGVNVQQARLAIALSTQIFDQAWAAYQQRNGRPVGPTETGPELSPAQHPIIEFPVDRIDVNKDVPQFKADADAKTGVVAPLGGKYERLGTGPIIVWEKADGTYEVITGRHRLDLARRSGEKTIPTQVVKELDGWTQQRVISLDAQSNIRSGQGTVKDFALYFHSAQDLTAEQAAAKGLTARAKGAAGWALGRESTSALWDLYANNQIPEGKAVAIARGAPNHDAAQASAIRTAKSKTPAELELYARNLARSANRASEAEQLGFGGIAQDFADFEREAEAVAKVQAERMSANRQLIEAAAGASKRPEAARKMGLPVKDPAALQARVEQLRAENRLLENPDEATYQKLRAAAGLAVEQAPEPNLEQAAQAEDNTPPLFARRTADERATQRAALHTLHMAWRRNADRLAPGLMHRFRLHFGDPRALANSGRMEYSQLTGYEQAAYDAVEKIFYLFDRALLEGSELARRLNLLHEMAHAHWDTLPPSRQVELLGLWREEISSKTGPLYVKGQLRPGVAMGVEESVKEWYAERQAWANHNWAAARIGAAPGQGIFGRLGQQFRQLLLQIKSWVEQLRGKQLELDFRTFLDQGARFDEVPAGQLEPAYAKRRGDRTVDMFASSQTDFNLASEQQAEPQAPAESTQTGELFATGEILSMAPTKLDRANQAAREGGAQEDGMLFARRNGTPGLSLGERLSDMTKGARAWILRNFTSAGGLPAKAFAAKVARDGRLSAIHKQMEFALQDLDLALHAVYGGYAAMTEAQLAQLNQVLGGRAPLSSVDPRLQAPLATMRNHIDTLSRRLIQEGAIEGEVALRVDGNLGFYLNRSYRKFDDRNWAQKVPEAVRNRAASFIRAQLRERLVRAAADAEYLRLGKPQGSQLLAAPTATQGQLPGVTPAAAATVNAQDRKTAEYQLILAQQAARQDLQPAEEEVQGYIDYLLGKGVTAADQLFRAPSAGQKDLRVLTKRKEIPPEIRALLGEYTDPRVNYLRSVGKTAQILEAHAYLTELRALGLGDWLHERPITNVRGQFTVPLAGDDNKAWAPLNGLYTTAEIADALKAQLSATDPAWIWWLRLNGWAKTAKTVLSPMTQVRNFAGNLGFLVANGHWRGHKVAEVWRAIRAEFGRGDAAARGYVARLSRLGILGESIHYGELREAIQDAGMKMQGFEEWTEHRLMRIAKAPFSIAARIYRLNDEIFKIYAFENERAQWALAQPNLTPAELDALAAERVRNTLPTYSLIPKAAQAVRRVALTGSFLSFPAEIVRTTYHAMNYARQDLRSSNPRIQAIGAKRLAGLITVATLPAAAAAMSKWLAGLDDDDERKLRRFLPEWNRNANLYFLGHDGKGRFRLVDASYLDPWNYVKKPLTAYLRREDVTGGLVDAMLEAISPFASEGIVTKTIFDLARNQDDRGRQIYNPELPVPDRAAAMLGHAWRTFEPGFVTQANRIAMAARGERSRTGRDYNLGDEIGAVMTGARSMSLDAVQGFLGKAREFAGRKGGTEQIYLEVRDRRGTVTEDEKAQARAKMEAARASLYAQISEDAQAARELGATQGEVAQALLGAGLSQQDLALILTGRYLPYQDKPASKAKVFQRQIQERR